MIDSNDKMPKIRLRAFQAVNEPDTCELFVKGHTDVLANIGVTKVTSSQHEWMKDPAVFVIVVESLLSQEVYGGARVHVSSGTNLLPIESATKNMDASVLQLISGYARQGTGEVCGLWNSPYLAGYGIGSPLLIRAGVAISTQIGIKSLFALCAPYTVKAVANCGMVLEDSIGNKGTFYYPKLDLVATAMVLKDVAELNLAADEDKQAIQQMRDNPDDFQLFELKQKEIMIDFKLKIPGLENWQVPMPGKS
jgi:hypothetical protein